MRRSLIILCACIATTTSAYADRTYRMYKTSPLGFPELLATPDAVIQVDEVSGRAEVYESDLFGGPDIFKGPKYVIEPDFEPSFDSINKQQHHRDRHDDCDGEEDSIE